MSFYFPTLAFFGDIGAGEVLVILAAILILFGGKGLPAMARKLGKTTQDLQKATHEFKKHLLSADQSPPVEPSPNASVSPDQDADKP